MLSSAALPNKITLYLIKKGTSNEGPFLNFCEKRIRKE